MRLDLLLAAGEDARFASAVKGICRPEDLKEWNTASLRCERPERRAVYTTFKPTPCVSYAFTRGSDSDIGSRSELRYVTFPPRHTRTHCKA